MTLDARGDIAAAVIAFYAPILAVAVFLATRHGFGREAGWIFLCTFSILRIVGGSLHIAAEEHPSLGLYIAAFAIESAGVAPLLLCTTSFLAIIGAQTHAGHFLSQPRVWRLVRLIVVVAFAVAISGATKASSDNPSTRNQAATLRRVGALLLLAVFAACALLHGVYWTASYKLPRHFKTLLIAISTALPFLAVRMIYSVLSAFSPAINFSTSEASTKNSLSKFNSFSGSWQIFLVMEYVMEYCVVLIYLTAGSLIPLRHEVDENGNVAPAGTKEDANKAYA